MFHLILQKSSKIDIIIIIIINLALDMRKLKLRELEY